MKAKLILIPLKEPKEGIKVLYKSITGYASDIIHTVTDKGEIWLSKGNEWVDLVFSPDELQQIAVCHKEPISPYCIPLHPNDYEKALPLIGKEVEFETVDGLKYPCSPVSENCVKIAKLITPIPIMYTDKEVGEILSKYSSDFWSNVNSCDMKDDNFNSEDWWNENKKK